MESVYIKELINPSTEIILHDIPKIITFYLIDTAKSNTNISNKKKTK